MQTKKYRHGESFIFHAYTWKDYTARKIPVVSAEVYLDLKKQFSELKAQMENSKNE